VDTFTPEAYGALLQREYTITPIYNVAEDEREIGGWKSRAVSEKALRRLENLVYKCRDRTPYEYIASFFQRHVGPAGRFFYAWPEFVASPDAAPTLTAVVSGAQAERTIFCKFAWQTALGITRASPAASLTIPLNNLIVVSLPVFPPSVTEAVIYATQGAAGTEVEQTTVTARTWTQPDGALLTGTDAPQTTNTAREIPTCKLIGNGFRAQRGPGATYLITLDLEETYS
jgi:hypothetical protein